VGSHRAGRFAEAETALRALIGAVDDKDHSRLCYLHGLLGTILNSLGRHDDATGALREALNQAEHSGGDDQDLLETVRREIGELDANGERK